MGVSVFNTAKLLAKMSAENRNLRELDSKIAELARKKDVEEAKKLAEGIGYPLLVKATAGGGGKGIRVVEREEDLEEAFHTASREAASAFGNGDVFLEKYLTHVRHVEMQVQTMTTKRILHRHIQL